MIKKLLLALVIITQISVLPSWGKDTVLIDRITQSEAEELDIQIPPETPSGFHQIQIEVSDDAGILSSKTILFCKNLLGEIKWDNNCPDVVEAAQGFMQPYDPMDYPEETQSTQVAAFALLGALAAGRLLEERVQNPLKMVHLIKKANNHAMIMKSRKILKTSHLLVLAGLP